MPKVPTSVTLPSFSQPVPKASCGAPYNLQIEEEKTQAWFRDGSA